MILARTVGFDMLDVTYVTRPYTTRHGAGPLPHEIPLPPFKCIDDETNISNLYQGPLRFAWLDLDLLARSIVNDLMEKVSSIALQHRLAITCMDQIDDEVTFIADAQLQSAQPEVFLQHVLRAAHAESGLASYGPTRTFIRNFELAPDLKSTPTERTLCKIA
jgi:adenylosuccinate synthase